jgi:deoxyribose-phosphate aldolase
MSDPSSNRSLARYIDHTLLAPTATEAAIRHLCREALQFHFRAVCVSGCWVGVAREMVEGSGVGLAAVVGFPHGNSATLAKCREAEACLGAGAGELDVVVNIGWLKSGAPEKVGSELRQLRDVAPQAILKLILETCYLNAAEKRLACQLALESGWDFVKTSTGFGPAGATVEDVLLMKEIAGETMQVKASGGIRDTQTARTFLQAGATRIGTSSGPAIVLGDNPEPL